MNLYPTEEIAGVVKELHFDGPGASRYFLLDEQKIYIAGNTSYRELDVQVRKFVGDTVIVTAVLVSWAVGDRAGVKKFLKAIQKVNES